MKNLIKGCFLIAFAYGVLNCGEVISKKITGFHYFETIEGQLGLEEKYDDDMKKSIFQKAVYQEIAISQVKSVQEENQVILDEEKNSQEVVTEEKNVENQESNANISSEHEEIVENVIEQIPILLPTTVIQENNLAESYNTIYHDVKIKNETNFNLTQEILTPNVMVSDKENILIFHTHTCESYTQTPEERYVASGNYRTTDLNHSVARVGTILEDNLTAKGFIVKHDLNYHDYPAYNGSYSRSFNTVKNLLSEKPTTQLVIDLHRDAIGSMNNYAPCVQIGDEVVSQLMFVIGTNGGGLEHPNWQKNLKFAIKVQEKAEEVYPGLFRPIILRNSRYNQNLADFACIIEVGATGNTLEQTTRGYEVFG